MSHCHLAPRFPVVTLGCTDRVRQTGIGDYRQFSCLKANPLLFIRCGVLTPQGKSFVLLVFTMVVYPSGYATRFTFPYLAGLSD